MNLERLEEGQTYKNYKELCEVLGEKTKAGKSKKIQLEEWGRYFEFKKNGNKILIDKVYTTPKEKISNRGSRGIYADEMQLLLTNLFYNKTNSNLTNTASIRTLKDSSNILYFTNTSLLYNLNLINSNYYDYRFNAKELSEDIQVNESCIWDVLEEIYKLNDITKTSIKALNRKRLIDYTEVLMVLKKEMKARYNELGEIIEVEEVDSYYREATIEERKIILKVEGAALKELGVEDKSKLFLFNRLGEFKKIVNKVLQEEYNIKYYYSAYRIIFNPDMFDYVENNLLKEIENNNHRKLLLDKIENRIIKNETNKINKAIAKSNSYEEIPGGFGKRKVKIYQKEEDRMEKYFNEDFLYVLDFFLSDGYNIKKNLKDIQKVREEVLKQREDLEDKELLNIIGFN